MFFSKFLFSKEEEILVEDSEEDEFVLLCSFWTRVGQNFPVVSNVEATEEAAAILMFSTI